MLHIIYFEKLLRHKLSQCFSSVFTLNAIIIFTVKIFQLFRFVTRYQLELFSPVAL